MRHPPPRPTLLASAPRYPARYRLGLNRSPQYSHRQSGAGMVGFLLALPPLLALGMGGVELAHWMHLRQAISLILTDAARAGATRQAHPQAIASAFESGLRQLYIQPTAIQHALTTRRQALGTPWTMHILQPTPAAFRDHADPDVVGTRLHPKQALIRNDYQAQQHARRLAQGWSQGRGPQSDLSIHEANTLVINLWWPQRPMVPGIAAIVRGLAPLNSDPIGQRMMTHGYLPMRRQVRMVMQSHPADWPDLADGRIRYATATDAAIDQTDNELNMDNISSQPWPGTQDTENVGMGQPNPEDIHGVVGETPSAQWPPEDSTGQAENNPSKPWGPAEDAPYDPSLINRDTNTNDPASTASTGGSGLSDNTQSSDDAVSGQASTQDPPLCEAGSA